MNRAVPPANGNQNAWSTSTVFEDYDVARWKVGTREAIAFPITSINESGGNRLVERERPYRDGAKFDDTGSKAKRFKLDAIFENSIEETGLSASVPLYPTILNQLIELFDIHGTGDLTLPTRGTVRARAESYERSENAEERDCARVTFNFVIDNEDSVDVQKFNIKTPRAFIKRVTEEAVFSAQSGGAWNTSFADLREFGSELEGFINLPGNTAQDMDTKAGIIVGTVNDLAYTLESPAGLELLKDPDQSLTQRRLEQSSDIASRAKAEVRAGRPPLVPYVADAPSNIYAHAAKLGQSAKDLIEVNPSVDPFNIPAGTVLNVFDTE